MEKIIKENLGFLEYLSNKEKYLPYSMDISTIDEEVVISDSFDKMMENINEVGFLISDIKKDIKDYIGFLAFLNIVKTKNLMKHSDVYLEIEYTNKEQEDDLTRFYEKLNLWNVRLIIRPTENTNVGDYIKYISAFITKILNKETFVSMEPTETFIKEKTNEIYANIQNREVNNGKPSLIMEKLVVERLDYEALREEVLISFREDQVKEIELMINAVTKSVFDIAKQDPILKHN